MRAQSWHKAVMGGRCRCKEACSGFDHRATRQLARSNFECWRNLGHNLNELTGTKISIPKSLAASQAVQSNLVYLPQEVLLVSTDLASRQINANR